MDPNSSTNLITRQVLGDREQRRPTPTLPSWCRWNPGPVGGTMRSLPVRRILALVVLVACGLRPLPGRQ